MESRVETVLIACSIPLRAGEEDEAMGEEPDRRFIIPFACAGEADYPRIGGKCTSLARMIAAGIRVPEGFAVTTDAYALHLQAPGLAEIVRSTLSSIDIENVADEERKSAEMRAAIIARAMPTVVEEAVRAAYRSMSSGNGLEPAGAPGSAKDLCDWDRGRAGNAALAPQGETMRTPARRMGRIKP